MSLLMVQTSTVATVFMYTLAAAKDVDSHWSDYTFEKLVGGERREWTDARVREELSWALQRIASAPIEAEPFPHINVPHLFSTTFYSALMTELPRPEEYTSKPYAGTHPSPRVFTLRHNLTAGAPIRVPADCVDTSQGGDATLPHASSQPTALCFAKTVHLHDQSSTKGSTLFVQEDPAKYPFWAQVFRLAHSSNFTRLLVDKFLPKGTEAGIPQWKQEHILNSPLKNTAALRIEPHQYHLTPHIDVHQKIVTWQFFHPRTSELSGRGMGTFFYKPKKGINMVLNDRKDPLWMDYAHFDPVKEIPVLPNSFFSFAPNARSFHGANISADRWAGVSDKYARRTFLGFITSQKDEWHHFDQGDWEKHEFSI